MADYTSAGTGDWDNVATWGGGGFPASGDTATIANTHIVSVKGAEACGDVTVNAGGTCRIDATAAESTLELDDGSTLANSGAVDFTGNGTNHAVLQAEAGGTATITGTQPDFDSGGAGSYVDLARLDLQMDVTTGGGGVTVEVLDDITIDGWITSGGDTWKIDAATAGAAITVTGNSTKALTGSGTYDMTGDATHGVTLTGQSTLYPLDGATLDLDYVTITSSGGNLYRVRLGETTTDTITYTKLDHLTINGTATYAGVVVLANGNHPIIKNSTITGGGGAEYFKKDIYIYTGSAAILDNCTLTNGTVALRDTSGWLVSKDHGEVAGDWRYYGALDTSDPDAGYNAGDWSADDTVRVCTADEYSTAFDTVVTMDEARASQPALIDGDPDGNGQAELKIEGTFSEDGTTVTRVTSARISGDVPPGTFLNDGGADIQLNQRQTWAVV